MKVFVYYHDADNSCLDAECCGGPCPYPMVKVFSTPEAAKAAGLTDEEVERLAEVELDKNEFVSVD